MRVMVTSLLLLLSAEAAVTQISSDSVLAKLVEEISRDEAAMRYAIAGKQMTRSELNNLLGHEPNRELRRQAWLAQQQLTLRTGERIRRAMQMRRALAAKYSNRSFHDLMLSHKGIRSRQQLLAWFEEIERATEPEYQRLVGRVKGGRKIGTSEPLDLDLYFLSMNCGFE